MSTLTDAPGLRPQNGPGARRSTPPRRIIIEPTRAWRWFDIRELWEYRELIGLLAWRDVKVRYKQTVLGAAWAVLQPLSMMIVFTVVFRRMAGVSSGDLPYPLFAYAGLLPWTFFASAVNTAGNSVIGSERLITKVYFPRLAIPFAAMGASIVDFAVAFVLLVGLMFYGQVQPGTGLFLAPLILGVIALAAMGLGTLLAALNVAYRDFRYVIPFLIQLGMFATPTIYMQPAAGEGVEGHSLLALNPMVALISAFRATMLGGELAWGSVVLASALSLLLFVVGCLVFRRVEDSFADII